MIVVKTENLKKVYSEVVAVNDLNLEIKKGSVFGLLGPNGAGKTTTLKMLMGFTRPTAGNAFILGQKVSNNNLEYRKKIGYLPDVPAFYNWMRADEYLIFSGKLMGIKGQALNDKVNQLLKISGLDGVDTKIGGFSRGMKQRLGLAQALINNPEIVFLDEPTSALDPIGRREVLELIKEFSGNATVVLSTHILTDVERVCDTVGILNKGNLIKKDTMSSLKNEYIEKGIRFEISGTKINSFEKNLKKKDWLEKIEKEYSENNSSKYKIIVNDLEKARQVIPGIISEHQLKLNKFDLIESTLEDIFVRVVNDQ